MRTWTGILVAFGLCAAEAALAVAPQTSPRPAPRGEGGGVVVETQVVASNLGFRSWIEGFRPRAIAAGIRPEVIDAALSGIDYNTDVIQRDRNQSEFTKQIWEYLDSAVSDTRVANGRDALNANAATLAGHVVVGNEVVVGGLSAVHQFVNIGDFAFIGGKTGVAQDVPPFMLAVGERATLRGLNLIGLRRHGFSSEEISALKSAYKLIWRSNQERNEVMQQVETELGHFQQVMKLLDFIRGSKRGTITPERI